jgi:3-mercaptopyruvate sulfurtransferase SseA
MTARGFKCRCGTKLRDVGFKDVTVLEGGFNAWEAAGYPVEAK